MDTRRRSTLLMSVLALAAPVLALSAPSSSAGGGTVLVTSVAHGGGLAYDTAKLTAKAGKVTIIMHYPKLPAGTTGTPDPHNIAIKGPIVQQYGIATVAPHGVNVRGKVVRPGGTSVVTAILKPGVYEFYCSVDGHEADGMKGTLIVKK